MDAPAGNLGSGKAGHRRGWRQPGARLRLRYAAALLQPARLPAAMTQPLQVEGTPEPAAVEAAFDAGHLAAAGVDAGAVDSRRGKVEWSGGKLCFGPRDDDFEGTMLPPKSSAG